MPEAPQMKEKQQRFFNVAAIMTAVIGVFYFFYVYLRSDRPFFYENQFTLLMPLVLVGFSIMVFLMKYLQTGSFLGTKADANNDSQYSISKYEIEKRLKDQQSLIKNLQVELNDSKSKISNIKSIYEEFTVEQKDEFISDIKKKIKNTATDEFIEEIRREIITSTEKDAIIDTIDEKCSESITRLNRETSALGRRGNLNLVLGILTTITGLFILYIYVSKINIDPKEPMLIAANFLPRLTLVIFIELFAYFFLKLYKSNLNEIKYFQNELTNIELKFVSLRTAVIKNDEKMIGEVITSLSTTERNFILEKGQTTVGLERHKTDSQTSTGAMSLVSDLIKKLKVIQ